MNFYTSVERIGNYILVRGYNNGKSFSRKVKYQPTFYLPSKTETPYRSLFGGKYLAPKKLDSMADSKDFLARYKDVSGFEISGNSNQVAAFIQEHYPNKIEFDISLINIFGFDIEVDISSGYPNMETCNKPITAISAKSSKKDVYYVFGIKDYDKSKTITGIDPKNIIYVQCKDEKEILQKFIDLWKSDFPDIVTGWNVEYFDVWYIISRIIRVFSEDKAKELSPWNSIRKKSTKIFNREQYTYDISGVSVIDYMDAFKKFGYKYGTQESYKLDHISYVVLGEKKLSYEEYGSLSELYEKNPQLYLDYCLKDTYLIQRFEDETALLSLVLTVAYKGGVNYSESFGTVGIWDTFIYRELMRKNIVPPVKSSPGEKAELEGGYVKIPNPGMKNWVVSFDLNSLYPHLFLQYNMSPETYIKDKKMSIDREHILNGEYSNKDGKYSVAANGVCFSKDRVGIIPEIVENLYSERKLVKTGMLGIEQEIEDIKNEINRREM
jgi:DNA polymerase elongation subunit (family B)